MEVFKTRMRKVNYVWSLGIFVLIVLTTMGLSVKAAWAGPRMYLDPATGTFSSNFDVVLKIDTETETVRGTEAILTYDTTRLGIVSVERPSNYFFEDIGYSDSSDTGELLIYNYEMDVFGKTGTGDLAIITFSVLGSGTAEVNFVCQDGVTTDTNMSGGDNSGDVIDCASVGGGSYTLSSDGSTPEATATPVGGNTTATPTDTAVATATPTDTAVSTATPTTATELPETGFALPSVLVMGIGALLAVFGLFVWF